MRLVRTTLADQVANALITRIEETGLRPGDEIPSELTLAQDFGVSRLVVREAIRMLTAREILVSQQGRAARVSTPSARVLAQMVDFRVRQDSLQIEDILETRRLVEGKLAGLAARRGPDGGPHVELAASLLQQMATAVDDADSFVELDMRFHATIAEAAGGTLLQLILASLESVLTRARRATYDARVRRGEGHESTLAAHQAILDAVIAGDEHRAVEVMNAHLDDTRRDIGLEGRIDIQTGPTA